MQQGVFTPQFVRLTVAHFFYWFCLDVFIPILPVHYHSMGMSDFEIGLIVGAISVGGVLLRIPAGKSLNHYGTVPIVALGLVLSLIGITGHFFAKSSEVAILSTLLQGIGLACYGSASLVMASLMFEDRHIVDVFAVYTMAGMFGVSLSLGVANWIYDFGGINCIVGVGLFAAGSALALFPKRPAVVAKIKQTTASALSKIVRNPKIYIPTFSVFTTYFCFSGAMTFLPLLMLSRGINDFNVFFVTYSVCVVIFRVMFVKFCHAFEFRHLETVAIATAAGTMLAIAVAESWPVLVFCGMLLGLSMGIGYPVMGSTIAENTSPADRGVALSLFASASDFGLVAGAAGLAMIAGFWDYFTLFFLTGWAGVFYAFLHWLRLADKLTPLHPASSTGIETQEAKNEHIKTN